MLLFYSENVCTTVSWLVSFPIDVRTRVTLLNKKIILGNSEETKLEVGSNSTDNLPTYI